MKIKETAWAEDDGILVRETWDPNPALNRARQIRDGKPTLGVPDGKHVATIPRMLLEHWLVEEGISYCDREAVNEMLARKLNSGEFAHFRTWGGTYNG